MEENSCIIETYKSKINIHFQSKNTSLNYCVIAQFEVSVVGNQCAVMNKNDTVKKTSHPVKN